MFKITEFSKISQVSAKALRYYDRIDLLKPSHIDKATGYRYYTADQLKKVHQILVFKDLGFTLEQMIPLMDGRMTKEQTRSMLLHKSAEVQNLLQTEQARLARLEARLTELNKVDANEPPLNVVVRQTEPTLIASIREVTSKADIPRMVEELEAFTKQHSKGSPQKTIVLWHSCAECEDSVDLEVAFPIFKLIAGDERVQVRELEGTLAACVAHSAGLAGSYTVSARLAFWLQENGYQIPDNEPSREMYWEHPEAADHSIMAEMQMPIERLQPDKSSGGDDEE